MPLSEDEQRILHEMEQKLYEHERGFAKRVHPQKDGTRHVGRLSIAMFLLGFVLLLLSFRQSLLLATVGLLVMVRAAIVFERGSRFGQRETTDADGAATNAARQHGLDETLGALRQKIKTRFFQQP